MMQLLIEAGYEIAKSRSSTTRTAPLSIAFLSRLYLLPFSHILRFLKDEVWNQVSLSMHPLLASVDRDSFQIPSSKIMVLGTCKSLEKDTWIEK